MAQKNEPVSQIEIAEALGLSQSTVSLALRGNKQVSAKTRELVAKKAEELGYIPDPKMGALSSYRRASTVERDEPSLAWVTNFPTREGWRKLHNQSCYIGAKRKAAELGFKLQEVWLRDESVSKKQLHRSLVKQGVRGLLFAAQDSLEAEIEFDLSAFSSVSIGYSLKSPILHSVDSYPVGNLRQAVRNLQRLGYARIGLAVADKINSRVEGAYYGRFLSINPTHDGNTIPPFMNEPFDDLQFGRWFEHWQPDAIIAWGDYLLNIEAWLCRNGLAVGRDVALAGLDLEDTDSKYAGIHQQSELIGEVAVGTLFSYLKQFAYGVPECAYQTLIDGRWVDGESAPRKQAVLV